MSFAWDPAKSGANVIKHGIDFADVSRMFSSPMLTALDTREDYGEDRWIGLGLLDGRVVVIVFTEPAADIIRILSARKALRDEQKRYEKFLQNELGSP